ncbi:hypothetical protein KM043_012458 [Ampulex compressa]|nr:hypothetical protein KM043_012458 [Ampulex compressa]
MANVSSPDRRSARFLFPRLRSCRTRPYSRRDNNADNDGNNSDNSNNVFMSAGPRCGRGCGSLTLLPEYPQRRGDIIEDQPLSIGSRVSYKRVEKRGGPLRVTVSQQHRGSAEIKALSK